MKVAVFSTKSYDQEFLENANHSQSHELVFFEARLNHNTAPLANGYPVVCVFVNDTLDAATLGILAAGGTGLIALRCTGFNNVDLKTATELGIKVVRVTTYSPYSVAEHVVALILTLNRKTHRAHNRVREGDFSLDGLMGFDLYGRTIGIIGTGKIGIILAGIMKGFGCNLLAYDVYHNSAFTDVGGTYVELDYLYAHSDIISLHCPLTPQTQHLINEIAIAKMKPGTMLINTSRGGLVDTQAVIKGLKSKKISAVGLDVYEQESELFFEDLSNEIIHDDIFQRLLTFPNVIITGHQAFFTREAVETISMTTVNSITDFELGNPLTNEIKYQEKIMK